jgi:hypothetical protein
VCLSDPLYLCLLCFLQLLGGSEDAFVREVSVIDPAAQTMAVSSTNLSLAQFAICNEFIRYEPTLDQRTRFTQVAEIESRLAIWKSVSDRLEQWLANRYEQNAQLGKLGFTDVLRRLWEEHNAEKQPHHA